MLIAEMEKMPDAQKEQLKAMGKLVLVQIVYY